MTSSTPTAAASSRPQVSSLGPAIDDYLAHGSVNLAKVRAVVVSQQGNLLAERYYRSDAVEHLGVQQVTWSVMSTLVGIALTKGDLTSLDQTVGGLFPDQRSTMSDRSAAVTIRQLLTMCRNRAPRQPHDWLPVRPARRRRLPCLDRSSTPSRRSGRVRSSPSGHRLPLVPPA